MPELADNLETHGLPYGCLAGYTALNVPITRTLSTPLTWPLMRAAGGPLRDSILQDVTLVNVTLVLFVAAVAAGAPWVVRSVRSMRWTVAAAAVLPAFVVLGPVATDRIETLGLHRNALIALGTSALPRILPAEHARQWRRSPFPGETLPTELARFRSAAERYSRRPRIHGCVLFAYLWRCRRSHAIPHQARAERDSV